MVTAIDVSMSYVQWTVCENLGAKEAPLLEQNLHSNDAHH